MKWVVGVVVSCSRDSVVVRLGRADGVVPLIAVGSFVSAV